MRNIKIVLEYDGTEFVGWQRQPNGRSVQQEVEEAIRQILRESPAVIGAGRTDAGVHARGQVANFKVTSLMEINEMRRALNAVLPNDVAVLSVEEVPLAFSARYDAKERLYRYYIVRRHTALERRFSWQLFYPLDLQLMNESSKMITGSHNFRSFCKSGADVRNSVCDVTGAGWVQESGGRVVFSISANRFLRGMARALVGTMVDVGRGFISLAQFESIMVAEDRSKAGTAAPPQGLFLEEVRY